MSRTLRGTVHGKHIEPAGIAIAWAFLFIGTSMPAEAEKVALPADLSRVAPDAAGVFSVRMSSVWNHAAFKPLRDHLTRNAPDVLAEARAFLGVNLSDVERLTLGLPDADAKASMPGRLLPT